MASREIKRPSTSDDSLSLLQSLLFKRPQSHDPSGIQERAVNPSFISPEEESLNYPPISLNSGHRQYRDSKFSIVFEFLVVATFVLGICASALRNPNYSRVSSFSYDFNSSSCVLSGVRSPDSPLYLDSFPQPNYLVLTLVITLILSLPILFLVLWLLNKFSKQIVYGSIPIFFIIPTLLSVYCFVACSLTENCRESYPLSTRLGVLIFVFIAIGAIAQSTVVNWHRVELSSKILGTAARALSQNLGLLAVLPSLTLALLVFYVPVVVFLVFAAQNGKIVPENSTEGYQCVWNLHNWVPKYFALAILTMLWSLTVMIEAQVYVVSGTIARWYFCSEDERPRGTIGNSLSNAFGPSFGTVCFSGLVMAVVRVIRGILDTPNQDDRPHGIIWVLLKCSAQFLLSAVDFINKFTIKIAAITGEDYCSSAKMAFVLLKRNLLSAVFVETLSICILVGISLVLSSVYAVVVWVMLRSFSSAGANSNVVAVSSFVLLMAAMSVLIHLLNEVIETVYLCYAIDKDKGEVSKQEVHSVYVLLPVNGSSHASPPPLV